MFDFAMLYFSGVFISFTIFFCLNHYTNDKFWWTDLKYACVLSLLSYLCVFSILITAAIRIVDLSTMKLNTPPSWNKLFNPKGHK